MSAVSFDRHALADAWLGTRRWAKAHPDLRDFHRQRYRALSNAFGVDLNAIPPTTDVGLAGLFDETVSVIETTRTPFSGYIEVDAQIHALHRTHGPIMLEAATELIAECRLLLADLIGALWELDEGRVVTVGALTARGWDPATPEPDPADFW